MHFNSKHFIAWAVVAALSAVSALAQGPLIIVGGALRASNDAVYEAIIEHSGLRGGGTIGILPAASSNPAKAAEKFAASLRARGVDAAHIIVLPLAMRDDASTTDVDESKWLENAGSAEIAEQIRSLRGIWMTGGDQSRIMRIFTGPDQSITAVGQAIMELHANGGLIAGSSAGAAVQSEVAILGGSSPAALRYGATDNYTSMRDQESGPLSTGKGMGVFPFGIIDQHFDRKARLGRLIIALMQHSKEYPHGFGIDEDTALVVDVGAKSATVAGSGCVTWVDVSGAERSDNSIQNIRIHVLASGDQLRWPGPECTIHPAKQPTVDKPYHDIPPAPSGSLFSPYMGRLDFALGTLLLDNSAADKLTVDLPFADGTSAKAVFIQDDKSAGYWGYLDGQWESYSATAVRLDLLLP